MCPAQNQLDSAGLCFHALKPIDNQTCAAWCITSQGWFHGKPIDLMVGEMCEQHNPCHRSVTIGADNSHEVSESFEKTRSTRNIDTDTKSNSTTHSTGISQSFSLSFSAGVSQGGDKGTAAAGVKADWETRMEDSMKWDKTDSRSVANSVESAFSLTENHVTRHSITLSLSVGTTRGGHIGMTYCGSWFAVPKVYFRCGNMAVGDFHDRGCHSNESRKGPVCELWVKIDSYSKGPPMGHSDTTPDNIEGERRFTRTVQHSQVFVRRDCDTGEILPPAFQDEAFRHSLSFYDYMSEHMTRFDDWTRKTHSSVRIARNGRDMKRMYGASRPVPSLTLTAAEDRAVGPANNYTIQVCMREGLNNPSNWCAYHKLPDRRCFTFGRGAPRGSLHEDRLRRGHPGQLLRLVQPSRVPRNPPARHRPHRVVLSIRLPEQGPQCHLQCARVLQPKRP